MKCEKCNLRAYHGSLCKSCFCKGIEKRIRKDLRLHKAFEKGDVLLIKDELCEYIVKRVLGSMPVNIVKSGKHNKKVLLWTLDDEISMFLGNLFENKKLNSSANYDTKNIKLFRTVKDDELESFAKANNIKFKKQKNDIKELVSKIEKKHPETKFSILKSVDKISEILQN